MQALSSLPSPGRIVSTITGTIMTAMSMDGIEYGIAKSILDWGTQVVEGIAFPVVAGVTGYNIGSLGLRIVNNALSFGLQTQVSNPASHNSGNPSVIPLAEPSRASVLY